MVLYYVRLVSLRSRSAVLRVVANHHAGCFSQVGRHVSVISRSSSSKPRSSDESGNLPQAAPSSPPLDGQEHLALAKPLDFDMASKIDGQESQMVSFELEPGQVIRVRRDNSQNPRRYLNTTVCTRTSACTTVPPTFCRSDVMIARRNPPTCCHFVSHRYFIVASSSSTNNNEQPIILTVVPYEYFDRTVYLGLWISQDRT